MKEYKFIYMKRMTNPFNVRPLAYLHDTEPELLPNVFYKSDGRQFLNWNEIQ